MRRELGAEVLLILEDVGGARDWGLGKIAMEEGVEIGPIDMGVTAVVSDGMAVVPLRDHTEGGSGLGGLIQRRYGRRRKEGMRGGVSGNS